MNASENDYPTQTVKDFLKWVRDTHQLVLCPFGQQANFEPNGRTIELLIAEWQNTQGGILLP